MQNTEKLQSIQNREQLIAFLNQENNAYSSFILGKLNRNPLELWGIQTQNHHIIPKHRGGPNAKWNFVTLTIEEHGLAHELLYQSYGFDADLGASQMIRGQIELGFETIRKLARATMQARKVSF